MWAVQKVGYQLVEGEDSKAQKKSCGRGEKGHDHSLHFEITYFSISLINGTSPSQTEARGLKNDAITAF